MISKIKLPNIVRTYATLSWQSVLTKTVRSAQRPTSKTTQCSNSLRCAYRVPFLLPRRSGLPVQQGSATPSELFCLSLIVLFLITIAPMLYAQQPTKVDPGKGEVLFNLGVPAHNIPSCVSCHGDAGNSPTAANPKLAAQHAAYTAKQLIDFKKRTERDQAVMSLYAQSLSDEDMRNISAYLAKQTLKLGVAKYKETIALGQKIYRAGIADRHVPACASCHGPSGAGIPIQYPRINGQWADYTEAQLLAFRSGTRKNSAPMSAIAIKLTDTEIKAVADYIAGLR